jgi:hypothetical protein
MIRDYALRFFGRVSLGFIVNPFDEGYQAFGL